MPIHSLLTYFYVFSDPGSFILSIPILMYQRLEDGYWYGPRQYCMERFPSKTHERAFILYQFIAVYLLPVLTISFCYSFMLKRVGQPTVEPVDNNHHQVGALAFLITINPFFFLIYVYYSSCPETQIKRILDVETLVYNS